MPRALQRFRLPAAITCTFIGAGVGLSHIGFHGDSTLKLLATLGIVALFLFAGLEVNISELRREYCLLFQHLAIQAGVIAIGAVGVGWLFDLAARPAVLFALALFTPSTGFILDSIPSLGLTPSEAFWVKSKAIASELLALGVLFVTVQSHEAATLGYSALVLVAMVVVLPTLFRIFARAIAPYAPNTEMTFLVMIALLCAYITRELGVYYLVGAFVVGITAIRLRTELPALSSENLLHALELFASFFIPFYFFQAGLHVDERFITVRAMLIGVGLAVVMIPLRMARVVLHRVVVAKEPARMGARIGLSMLPTLVFTMVIAEILEERYGLAPDLFGALLLYAVITTLLPGLILKVSMEFETPEVPAPAHSTGKSAQSPVI